MVAGCDVRVWGVSGDDTYRVHDAEVVRDTALAVLVRCPALGSDTWIPKSQIDNDSEVWGDDPDGCGPGVLIVSRWFARKHGWC